MVEMRWVWGSEPEPEFGENMARKVKVLQYRYMSSTAKYGNGAKVWSEWMDVLTVTEEGK